MINVKTHQHKSLVMSHTKFTFDWNKAFNSSNHFSTLKFTELCVAQDRLNFTSVSFRNTVFFGKGRFSSIKLYFFSGLKNISNSDFYVEFESCCAIAQNYRHWCEFKKYWCFWMKDLLEKCLKLFRFNQLCNQSIFVNWPENEHS